MTGSCFTSSKTYRNLPCCHRQWRHSGHCTFLHGYSRSYTFHFACNKLDESFFVVDFSALQELKSWLDEMFDHTTLICADDPKLPLFETMHKEEVINLRVLPSVSMEASAKFVWEYADKLIREKTGGRAWVQMVEARENDKNAATFTPPI